MKHNITIYSKAGCHLCEDAKAALLNLSNEFEFDLTEYDITHDPALFEKYQYYIPVFIIDRRIKLELQVDAKQLRRALADGLGPKVSQDDILK
jgi:glutaredoxin